MRNLFTEEQDQPAVDGRDAGAFGALVVLVEHQFAAVLRLPVGVQEQHQRDDSVGRAPEAVVVGAVEGAF